MNSHEEPRGGLWFCCWMQPVDRTQGDGKCENANKRPTCFRTSLAPACLAAELCPLRPRRPAALPGHSDPCLGLRLTSSPARADPRAHAMLFVGDPMRHLATVGAMRLSQAARGDRISIVRAGLGSAVSQGSEAGSEASGAGGRPRHGGECSGTRLPLWEWLYGPVPRDWAGIRNWAKRLGQCLVMAGEWYLCPDWWLLVTLGVGQWLCSGRHGDLPAAGLLFHGSPLPCWAWL